MNKLLKKLFTLGVISIGSLVSSYGNYFDNYYNSFSKNHDIIEDTKNYFVDHFVDESHKTEIINLVLDIINLLRENHSSEEDILAFRDQLLSHHAFTNSYACSYDIFNGVHLSPEAKATATMNAVMKDINDCPEKEIKAYIEELKKIKERVQLLIANQAQANQHAEL